MLYGVKQNRKMQLDSPAIMRRRVIKFYDLNIYNSAVFLL